MERHAFELFRNLSELTEVKLIKWGGSNKWLPLVFPYLLFSSLWALLTTNTQVIYLHDGLLAPLGLILRLFRKPIIITIHGRDIAYENRLYQFIIPMFLKKADKVICVSSAIRKACTARGIDGDRTVVIANGVSDEFHMNTDRQALRNELAVLLGSKLNGKIILLSAGRLIKNKGFHWFVAEIMPKIKEKNCIYIVAGDGVLAPAIRKIISEKKLDNDVFLVGWANKSMLKLLYNAADVFVMPNVPKLMEGFGLVALEASSCCLPVVASALEGIKEAVKDGKNGFLVEPGNANGFITRLKEIIENKEMRGTFGIQARRFTLENFGWRKMTKRYLDEFSKLSRNNGINR